MEAPQGVQLTGTNRPRTYHKPRTHPLRSSRSTATPTTGHNSTQVTAATAEGKRPDPSRTRKLSPPAPMVLHPPGCGRVGHRRTPHTKGPPPPPQGAPVVAVGLVFTAGLANGLHHYTTVNPSLRQVLIQTPVWVYIIPNRWPPRPWPASRTASNGRWMICALWSSGVRSSPPRPRSAHRQRRRPIRPPARLTGTRSRRLPRRPRPSWPTTSAPTYRNPRRNEARSVAQ